MNKQSLIKQFAKYVSVNILGMIGLSCYILADTFFIAQGIGADGLTSLNIAIPMYSFMYGVGMMIGMGGATRYGITGGVSESHHKNAIFSHAVRFAVLFSIFFVILGVGFAGPVSKILGADSATFEMTKVYMRTFLVFAPMFMLNSVIICFVRNDGNPNLAMIAMVCGSFSNIVLDYIYVFPLQMGMFGAALATGTAPIISMLILSRHFIKKKNGFRYVRIKTQFKYLKDFCALGVSSLITEFSSGIVIIVFNFIILSIRGNMGVAAYGVIANLALVVIAVFNGIGQGVQPLLSYHYGQGKSENVQKLLKFAMVTAIALAVVIYAVTSIGAALIVAAFNKDGGTELAAIAEEGLRLYFIGFIFAAVNIVTAVYFSSVDKPMQSFVVSILRGFVAIIPAAMLLSFLFDMTGVWIAFPAAEFITSIAAVTFILKTIRAKHK